MTSRRKYFIEIFMPVYLQILLLAAVFIASFPFLYMADWRAEDVPENYR